jgi:hypothetical protein
MYCLYKYVLIATASRMTMHASRKGCITSVFAMDRLVGMNTSELSANTATALYASVLRGFVPAAGNEDTSPRSYRGIMIVCVLDSARWEEAVTMRGIVACLEDVQSLVQRLAPITSLDIDNEMSGIRWVSNACGMHNRCIYLPLPLESGGWPKGRPAARGQRRRSRVVTGALLGCFRAQRVSGPVQSNRVAVETKQTVQCSGPFPYHCCSSHRHRHHARRRTRR